MSKADVNKELKYVYGQIEDLQGDVSDVIESLEALAELGNTIAKLQERAATFASDLVTVHDYVRDVEGAVDGIEEAE